MQAYRSYNGSMDGFSLTTPEQVSQTLAARIRALRLARGWKQSTLAKRSGVSLASLRRFEESGKVSLQSLLKLAFALNRLDDFDGLLQPPPASSIAELEAAEKRPPRKRGRL
jgi:HTH-type transcriptional regulator/antitoxin HipB